MSSYKSDLIIWTLSGSPLNSIRLQAGLLADVLQKQFNVGAVVLNSQVPGYKRTLSAMLKSAKPVIWQYGGFDSHLTYAVARRRSTVFVYHNITPAKYLAATEARVAVGSLLGRLQLRLLPKQINWVACSPYSADELAKCGFKNVVVCPNIVPGPRAIAKGKSEPTTLLFVGRISPNKRCAHLVAQVGRVAENLRSPVELVIVGSGKSGSRELNLFERALASVRSHPFLRVKWISVGIGETALGELFAAATLYVSAAVHEGFGLPVCEAILHGTPAVYTECGGTESILKGCGMIRKESQNSMSIEIVSLLQNPQRRASLLARQATIVREFTYPAIFASIKTAYCPLVGLY